MRPKTFIRKMNKAIDELRKSDNDKPMKLLLPEMKRVWKRWSKNEGDFRSGHESYGYDTTGNTDSLMYISDRWRCAFRLKWLIDGIENNHFDKGHDENYCKD